jgi:hypothetical protein
MSKFATKVTENPPSVLPAKKTFSSVASYKAVYVPGNPCYFAIRTPKPKEWILISYIPDNTDVRFVIS